MAFKQPHIVVVGAGIVGASLAYHLTRSQARVTLLDKALNPGESTTDKSFAWITVNPDAPETYIKLRQQAIADWHRVESELKGQLRVDWCGALTWRDDPIQIQRLVSQLTSAGHPVRLVDQQQIRLLEPNLKNVPPQAMLAEHEGAIDARLTTDLLISAARRAGATVQLGNEILSLIINGSRLTGVATSRGKIAADIVVLATGISTITLCQPLAIRLPIHISPAILVAFRASHRFVNRIISGPLMDLRTASPGLILWAADYLDESEENNPRAIARRGLEKMKSDWQTGGALDIMNVIVGNRAIPDDGLPIIGQMPGIENLYVSVMHAGVTLAAVAGRLATRELLGKQEEALLASFRPARFHQFR